VVLSLAGPSARADVKKDSALASVPDDSAFFIASLRNKEQCELLTGSKAFKALQKLPLYQMALKQLQSHLHGEDGPLAGYKKFMEDKDNQELVQLIHGALADEIFVWGGKGWGDLMGLAMKLNSAQQFAPLEGLLGGVDPQKAQARAVLLELNKNRKLIKVPELVFGFRVQDPKKVLAQVRRAEKPLTQLAQGDEKTKGKVKMQGDFLTLVLDGSLVPWDDLNLASFEENKGEFDNLISDLKKATLTVSLGVKGNYLLLGVTSTLKDLDQFGGDAKALASRSELEPLDKFASKKITLLSYFSKDFITSAAGSRNYSDMAGTLKRLVDKSPLKDERKKAISKDIDTLFARAKEKTPDYGAGFTVAFHDGGVYESYSYDYGNHDAQKGIDTKLVNHVGGDPILALGFGCKVDGSSYAWFSKFARQVYSHGEAIFMDMADDDAKATWKKTAKVVLPLIQRLDDTTTKSLIPALRESGIGFVLDAKWSSKQWLSSLPKMDKPLPMLELGLLIGISDAKKFEAALKDYRVTLNELYEKAREASPVKDNIPEFKLPAPETEKGTNGTLYWWPLPEDTGLDKQFLPTIGVAPDVAVLTFSKAHSQRLMKSTKPAVKDGPLTQKRQLVGFVLANPPALIDAALPWADFAINALVPVPDDAQGAKQAKEMAASFSKQARELARILKCYRGASSATYLENGKLVTHTQKVFKDLDDSSAPPKGD
jgi:hypothetical protein